MKQVHAKLQALEITPNDPEWPPSWKLGIN